jgi:tRNA(Arg) A34 adenosine deaminase TadA
MKDPHPLDEDVFLRRAIELGQEAMRRNRGGPFGAVVVIGGQIVGEGANAVLATNDPTAHAEVMATRDATAKRRSFSLHGGTLYASSEPCPMCLAAIYWARLDRIVYGSSRSVAASAGFDDAFFYEELARDPMTRRVPMRQIELPDAAALFDEWNTKLDKTPY